jgi:hypothetical protein
MTTPDRWVFDYYQLYQDCQALLAFFPQSQKDKDDPERAKLEHAAWHRFYKRQIAFRLPSITQE